MFKDEVLNNLAAEEKEIHRQFAARVQQVYPAGTKLELPKGKGVACVTVVDAPAQGAVASCTVLVRNDKTGTEYRVRVASFQDKG